MESERGFVVRPEVGMFKVFFTNLINEETWTWVFALLKWCVRMTRILYLWK